MKNVFLILTMILFIITSVKSQISYENRIELKLKDGYKNEEIFEFGKYGFILSSKSRNTINNQNEWKYEKYDIELKSVKIKNVLLSSKLLLDETFTNEERIHSLFKDRKGNFSLVTIESSNLKITEINGSLPKKARIKDMSVLGDYAFFNASIKKSPFLFSINWKTGEKNLIPIVIEDFSPKKTNLMNFQVLESSNQVFVYAKTVIDKKKNDIYVIHLNNEGKKEGVFNLTRNIEKNIIDVSALKLKEDKYIYTGTYSTKYTYSSEGLFFAQTTKNEIDFIKFYSFIDLENFLSYLPEKRQEKIEKKKAKKERKGKEIKFNYKISAHELILLDDEVLFLGEAYYPTYRTQTYTTTSTVNGVTTTQTNTTQVFNGYQYTHAILGKFDEKGELLWDEIFEMRSAYKPFYVKRFISISEKSQNSIKLVFASRNKINSKSIDYSGIVLQDSQSEEIQTTLEGDNVKYSFSNIDYWYDNYFIAYGSQVIKNTDDKTNSKKKRKVYFINKIKFEK